jgi:hypothetical protein
VWRVPFKQCSFQHVNTAAKCRKQFYILCWVPTFHWKRFSERCLRKRLDYSSPPFSISYSVSTVFTKAHFLIPSWDRSIQITPSHRSLLSFTVYEPLFRAQYVRWDFLIPILRSFLISSLSTQHHFLLKANFVAVLMEDFRLMKQASYFF